MIRKVLPFMLLALWTNLLLGQLPNGSPAPDFTVDLISKTSPTAPPTGSFTLSAETGQGKGVCLTFSATWCGPCWSFHNSGVAEEIYNRYGPNGTNEAEVLFIEADMRTNRDCMFGNNANCSFGTSLGDWTNVPYGMTDLSNSNGPTVASDYGISFYPTLYVVSPDMRVYQIRNRTLAEYESWLLNSFKLDATENVNPSNCGNDGAITLDVVGGYGNLDYRWSNGARTKDLNGIEPGTYSVTITDDNGYDKEFGPFTVTGVNDPVVVNTQLVQDVSCNGLANGIINVSGQGGTPGYSYSWSNGDNSPNLSNLPAGNYTVTITDINNCIATESYIITEPFPLLLDYQVSEETCSQNNGQITVQGFGGTAPYQYAIDDGQFSTNNTFNNLGEGLHKLDIRDANNCIETEYSQVDNIPPPTAEAGDPEVLGCGVDSLELSGEGSEKGPFIQYQWTTDNGNILRGGNTLTPEIDKNGTYFIEVLDEQTGCESIDSVVVMLDTSVIARPGKDTLVNCMHPEIELDGTESSKGPDIVYKWETKGGEIINGDTSLTPLIGKGGIYTLIATDTIKNCIDSASVTVEADTLQPELEIAEPDVLDCINTQVTLDATGSSSGPGFSYEWQTQNGNIVSGENTLMPVVDEDGDYTLIVTDSTNGCEISETVAVEEDRIEPVAQFGFVIDTLSIQFTDRSEGMPNIWSWDFGDGTTSNDQNPIHVYGAPGTYEVCLTITNDCGSETMCETVQVGFGLILSSYIVGDVSCNGGNDGYIDVTISGGIQPYSFEWSTGSQVEDLYDIPSGSYELTITDNSGTSLDFSFEVDQPEILAMESVEVEDAVEGVSGGSIELSVTGGTAPYSYNWSNGDTTAMIEDLEPGSYSCTVTDLNGCEFIFGPFNVGSVTNASKFDALEKLQVYPNPVGNILYVDLAYSTQLETLIRLISVSGDVAWQSEWTGKEAEINIDIADFPAGTYILTIITKNGTAVELINVVH